METEQLPERPDWDNVQMEQEREQRRMRDRLRRQSMSLEDREKHLARRRRNYQLRRQRAEHAKLVSYCSYQTSPLNLANENKSLTAVSGDGIHCDGAVHVGCSEGPEELNALGTKYLGAEAGVQKSAKFPRRVRLNHMRHLARLLNSPMSRKLSGDCYQIEADVITKEIVTTNCRSRKKLRLTHLKHLARALNSTTKETADHIHLSKTQGTIKESLPQGEFQWMNVDVLKNVQSNNANCKWENSTSPCNG